jgi:hypothetical protein
MMASDQYNYEFFLCYALVKSKEFFKRMERYTLGVKECMVQLVGLHQKPMVNRSKWIFMRTRMITLKV